MTFAATKLLNLILPPRCIKCRNIVEKSGGLCSYCWSKIEFITKSNCSICGFPFEYDMGVDTPCAACIAKKPPYDKAVAVFIYNDKSSDLITYFKYGDKIHAASTFAELMYNKCRDQIDDADIIIPVPLHPKRLLRRRYNQSALISNHINRLSGVDTIPDLMSRKKNNVPQASLSKKERLQNVKGAFSIKKKYINILQNKNIILIDDVMTTGATVSECAKVLKKSGASKVEIITLAKTVE